MILERQNKVLTGNQLTLIKLINKLEEIKKNAEEDCIVVFSFGCFSPCGLRSWRGIYEELAISFARREDVMLINFIKELKEAIGKKFEGYKGGEYIMSESTPLWADNYGKVTNEAVIGAKPLRNKDAKLYSKVVLLTEHKDPYDN